jgi:hypothetical protein
LKGIDKLVKGDNYKTYNVLTLMLEDTNALIFLEATKIIEMLATLNDKGIVGKYGKKYTEVLFERFKETKTSILGAIRKTLDVFITNQIIGIDQLIEIALTLDSSKNTKNKKVIVSSSKAKSSNPRAKQNALEYIKDHLGSCNMAMD